ncbi:hypothetical protein DY000_02038805 [Brassica cretica]|uniref:Uncharacterized protein n=1 Tax=Brassica cretica TaxID=69181 RepID=A0ABQ7BGA8_BRACR|nr:hypothetical protein DY000_02038805 [Brassica cretica]
MFGSIVIQNEVENDHWASRGAGATYWSEVSNLERPLAATSSTRSAFRRDTSMIWSGRAQQGQVAAVTWSDLVERRSVPALGPTSRR